MPLVVNTNVMSLNAQRHLAMNTNSLSKSLEKLASGYRINRAADDAAGLQLSENLRAQIRGSKKALDNVQDGINVLNIADGAFDQITQNLQRVRELAVQASNDTYSQEQRDAIASEIVQLLDDNDRIADSTQFNGLNLLDGTFDPAADNFYIQLGANADSGGTDLNRLDIVDLFEDISSDSGVAGSYGDAIDQIYDAALGELDLDDDSAAAGGLNQITSNADGQLIITQVDVALTALNTTRGQLGATVNRLEGAANNLMTSIENLSSSESRIRNVDVAAESAEMVRSQILQQSAATVLAQANQAPSLALSLLQG